ncbi:hypothetical protein DRW03_20440 [Corallococcus sp. H22C18031201]|nr:hypothetical protein DRW03_20440 [Corallococcus sp. H22C18031201]
MKPVLMTAALAAILCTTSAHADTFQGSVPLPAHYAGNMPSNALQVISTQPYIALDWSGYTAPAGQSLYARLCMSYTDSGSLSANEGIWVAIIPYLYTGSNAHYWLFNTTGSSSTVSKQACSNYSDSGAVVNGWIPTSALSCQSSPLNASCTLKAYANASAATLPVTINSVWLEVVSR